MRNFPGQVTHACLRSLGTIVPKPVADLKVDRNILGSSAVNTKKGDYQKKNGGRQKRRAALRPPMADICCIGNDFGCFLQA
jgi:hypothetical protein